jgi:hypothetical protein
MVEIGWLPRPTSIRVGRPSFAAKTAAVPELVLAVPVVSPPLEPLEVLELLEPLELPELLEVPEPFEPLDVLAPLELLGAALVVSLAVEVDVEPAPPQAARASEPAQHNALSSGIRNFSKANIQSEEDCRVFRFKRQAIQDVALWRPGAMRRANSYREDRQSTHRT